MGKPEKYFIAWKPLGAVAEDLCQLAVDQQRQLRAEAQLTESRFLHLTLLPIDAQLARNDRLVALMAESARKIPPIDLRLDRLRNVPASEWHCWVIEPTMIPQLLKELFVYTCRNVAQATGAPLKAKNFHPHITLSYFSLTPLPNTGTAPIQCRIGEVVMVRSFNDGDMRKHEIINSWVLSGKPRPAQQLGLI